MTYMKQSLQRFEGRGTYLRPAVCAVNSGWGRRKSEGVRLVMVCEGARRAVEMPRIWAEIDGADEKVRAEVRSRVAAVANNRLMVGGMRLHFLITRQCGYFTAHAGVSHVGFTLQARY